MKIYQLAHERTGRFGPPKTEAGFRTVTLLQPAIDALKAQSELTAQFSKTEIAYHHREYGLTKKTEHAFCFHATRKKRRTESALLTGQYCRVLGLCCKTCWYSPPQSVPYTAHFRMLVVIGRR